MVLSPAFRHLIKVLTVLLIGGLAYGVALAGSNPVMCLKVYKAEEGASNRSEYPDGLARFLQTSARQNSRDVGFTTVRNLKDYQEVFPNHILKRVKSLNEDEIILDAGCGDAFLADSLFSMGSFRSNYVGVTYALNTRSRESLKKLDETGRFHLHTGRFFEDIPNIELTGGKKVKMITDFWGVMSYTSRIDLVLKKYLDLLDTDGQIFLGNQAIASVDGVSFSQWIRSIPGIRVREGKAGDSPSSFLTGLIIERDLDQPLKIPELELTSFEQSAPPDRQYRSTNRFLNVP